MNEIKEAIILAAGSSRRMGLLCEGKHKSLLKYKENTILARIINQLKKANIEKLVIVVGFAKDKIIEETKNIQDIEIKIVENPRYYEDTNIYSMKLALDHIENPFIIVEADMITEDALIQYLAGSDFEGKSTWLTKGKFNDMQYGGILRSDELGNINDIRIVPEYRDEYQEHTKLTGLMRVGPNEVDLFKKLVNIYAEKTFKQYFLIPWIENLTHLPCIEGDASQYKFSTFNSPEDYYKAIELEFDEEQAQEKEINFIETERLKHIENFDEDRVQILIQKIERDGAWLKPIYIEKNHNLVLDGQHRLQAAIRMGIKKSLMVVDMPHNTYRNPKEALKNAKKIMSETKSDAVKLEGGKKICQTIKILVKNKIPVMGHLGLLPQTDKTFKFKGKKDSERNKIFTILKNIKQCVI